MAKSNAEIQKAYRDRQRDQALGERLNIILSVTAKRKLERLARHQDKTQRDVLEALLEQAEADTIATLKGRPTELTDYLDSTKPAKKKLRSNEQKGAWYGGVMYEGRVNYLLPKEALNKSNRKPRLATQA
ncbi:hypothetical protein [Methylomonas sp. DH-1]|uniref:hypothetical protein n=1 Tax=Methylomonas sp. (strain DH-1) TaxID=1727196 RepID=UPI0012F6E0EA|nr:hypothetical protein [Methylomonas sp. DH-1]